jgi:hypothetical protein
MEVGPPYGCHACGWATFFSHSLQTVAADDSGGSRAGVTGSSKAHTTGTVGIAKEQRFKVSSP